MLRRWGVFPTTSSFLFASLELSFDMGSWCIDATRPFTLHTFLGLCKRILGFIFLGESVGEELEEVRCSSEGIGFCCEVSHG